MEADAGFGRFSLGKCSVTFGRPIWRRVTPNPLSQPISRILVVGHRISSKTSPRRGTEA